MTDNVDLLVTRAYFSSFVFSELSRGSFYLVGVVVVVVVVVVGQFWENYKSPFFFFFLT